MASEALVDLSYRGLVLGKRLRLLQVGPRSAYVAHDAPMPVGTELVLTVDETLAIPAQVARVREGDSKDGPAGMWLWADAAEQRARAWWDAHVTAEAPRIPEPGGGRIRTEAPVAPAAPSPDLDAAEQVVRAVETPTPMQSDPQPDDGPSDAGDTSQEIPSVTAGAAGDVDDQGVAQSEEQPDEQPDEHADEQPDEQPDEHAGEDDDDYAIELGRAATNVEPDHGGPEASDADEEAPELPRDNTHGRPARGTQVMTAVEIADVLGMPPVLDSYGDTPGAVGRQREIRTTHVMSAVEVEEVLASGGEGEGGEPAPRDDGSAKGKARSKRRGRKRR